MAGVKQHYDQLLARHYSWMCGGFEAKSAEYRIFFDTHGIRPALSGVAVDLGAGPGFQSIPLSKAGFEVVAVDLSRGLLAELKSNAAGLPIAAIEGDLLDFPAHIPSAVEIIVCMGDTITHLNSLGDARLLLEKAGNAVEDDGRLILGFRDLTPELKGLDRFIPVRSDAGKIFTCFLEYEKEHVKVHDIVHEKTGDHWVTQKSWFRKLRISTRWMKGCLQKSGFTIEHADCNKGMVTIIARKRPE